jgi:methylthioribose-1-phosphate isomerase
VIEAIRVNGEVLEILDQRALPTETRYLACLGADDVIAAIQSLAVRGAPALGVAGVYGLWAESRRLADSPDFWTRLEHARERLKNARPTAVNLAWAVERVWERIREQSAQGVEPLLRQMAEDLAAEESRRNELMGENGSRLLTPHSRVLTHCNTGSLATMGIGTALGVIRTGFGKGLVKSVWVDETRPLLQGARLTAWELMEDGIPATLIADGTAASLMARKEVDAVIVGADRICANGDTANKIGTYGLAVLAHYHGIPFYVAAPVSTVDLSIPEGSGIPIEQRSADEVRRVRDAVIAPADVAVFNPAFDVTPGHLISAIITDRGILRAPYTTSLAGAISDETRSKREADVHD